MRIRRDQVLLGIPALELRKLMRRWGSGCGDARFIRTVLQVSESEAGQLLQRLQDSGYVECEAGMKRGNKFYVMTVKGCALAGASAAQPIRRELAQRRLHELIERMAQANRDDRFLVGVQEAAVFGSYLTSQSHLGDLDVHYTTYRKIGDAEEFMRVSRRLARASGRRFDRFIDELYWPETELGRFLKNRSRVYSLADNSQLLEDSAVARLTIFADRRPVKGWNKV